MNRIDCAIIAITIIAFAIIFDAFAIASHSQTMFLTIGDRILICIIWNVLFGWGAYEIWDSRAK